MGRSFESERLILRTSDTMLAESLADYFRRNRTFFESAEPARNDEYYTADHQRRVLEVEERNMELRTSAYYYYFLKEDPDRIIGSISFVRIRREPYASTIFGYDQDEFSRGQGYCTEACAAAIEDVIRFAPIHRIEARVLPENAPSIHILEHLGFRYEGMEYGGVRIGGEFRDHRRYSLLNENYPGPAVWDR